MVFNCSEARSQKNRQLSSCQALELAIKRDLQGRL